MRDALKDHNFRWHRTKGVWYGKADRADIVKALQAAYKAEETDTEVDTPAETETAPAVAEAAPVEAETEVTEVTEEAAPAEATEE